MNHVFMEMDLSGERRCLLCNCPESEPGQPCVQRVAEPSLARLALEAWADWAGNGKPPLEGVMHDGKCIVCCHEEHAEDCPVLMTVKALVAKS